MKSSQNYFRKIIFISLGILISLLGFQQPSTLADTLGVASVEKALAGSYFEVSEGKDFATQVMHDPWDMSEFTDISQNINPAGMPTLLTDIQVANGVFSAHSTATKQSSIYPLFPGNPKAMLIGKIGAVTPINPNTYKCMYAAAKVDSGAPENGSPDQMVVFWFDDETINYGTFGQTLPGIVLYPEAGFNTPVARWKLYSARLDQVPTHLTKWLDAPDGVWRGFRVDATIQNTSFAIDWIRLTDCNSVNISIPWTGIGPVSVSVVPIGTSRDILVASNVTTSPYVLDTQGMQVGAYQYFVRKGTTVYSSGTFRIKPAPITQLENPSAYGGEDLATVSGDAWDMSQASDINTVKCTATSFVDGNLVLKTPPLSSQPSYCVYDNVSDAQFNLSTTLPADTSQYRYFSFRIHTDYPYTIFGSGMIARLVWYLQGVSGLPDNRCLMVSDDMPYDVNWYTVTVDLFDPLLGEADQNTIVDCPTEMGWTDNSPALLFRFDPNENVLSTTLTQKIDWIRLTKVEQVTKGTPYVVNVNLNMPWYSLTGYKLYYTTDRANPTQHLADFQVASLPGTTPNLANKVYLPNIITLKYEAPGTLLGNEQTLTWLTSNVSLGDYYLCLQTTANGITTTSCSDAVIKVK